MATIVNTPPAETRDNGSGFLLGIVLLIVVAILFFYYGLPVISRSFSGPSVNVPGNVNVNVHTPNSK